MGSLFKELLPPGKPLNEYLNCYFPVIHITYIFHILLELQSILELLQITQDIHTHTFATFLYSQDNFHIYKVCLTSRIYKR